MIFRRRGCGGGCVELDPGADLDSGMLASGEASRDSSSSSSVEKKDAAPALSSAEPARPIDFTSARTLPPRSSRPACRSWEWCRSTRAWPSTAACRLGRGSGRPDRRWAVDHTRGLGRHLAQWLLARGETVVDVPPAAATAVLLALVALPADIALLRAEPGFYELVTSNPIVSG